MLRFGSGGFGPSLSSTVKESLQRIAPRAYAPHEAWYGVLFNTKVTRVDHPLDMHVWLARQRGESGNLLDMLQPRRACNTRQSCAIAYMYRTRRAAVARFRQLTS